MKSFYFNVFTASALLLGLTACETEKGTAGQEPTVATPADKNADPAKDDKAKAGDKDPAASADAEKDDKDSAATPGHRGKPADVGLGVEAGSDREIEGEMAKVGATLRTYSTCATTCNHKGELKPTNLESCMLSCRNAAESGGITPKSKAHGLMLELDTCMGICDEKDVNKETNRETCFLNCDNAFHANAALLKVGDDVAK